MSKKGARQDGGSAGRSKNKNSEMAKRLPPSPDARPAGWRWPYHSNNGTSHRKPGGGDH